jgi:hypothetical protein
MYHAIVRRKISAAFAGLSAGRVEAITEELAPDALEPRPRRRQVRSRRELLAAVANRAIDRFLIRPLADRTDTLRLHTSGSAIGRERAEWV